MLSLHNKKPSKTHQRLGKKPSKTHQRQGKNPSNRVKLWEMPLCPRFLRPSHRKHRRLCYWRCHDAPPDFGHEASPVAVAGPQRRHFKAGTFQWKPATILWLMDIYGYLWIFVDVCGYLHMDICGYLWISMDTWNLWLFMLAEGNPANMFVLIFGGY